MRQSILVGLVVGLTWAGQGLANPTTVRLHIPDAEVVGEGRLKVFFWNVFDAVLYAPGGVWSNDRPFALSLSYLGNFDGSNIVQASIDEMRAQGMNDEPTLERWGNRMASIFPDVDDQTNITGIVNEARHALFYLNGEQVGAITDPAFSQRFFDIWLGEKTSNPGLRTQLIEGASQ